MVFDNLGLSYSLLNISNPRFKYFELFQKKAAPTAEKTIPKEAEEIKTQRKLKLLPQMKFKLV